MSNFWQKLPKPFTVLAPMDDVTDAVFRQVVLKAGRPDVFFTEFANSDGLVHGGHGIPLRKLKFTPAEHPIVAQIWGNKPDNMAKAAKMVKDLGFDGVDINMGCPVKEVIRKDSGSGLIGKYELSANIIQAVKKSAKGIPVSVKTRPGLNENIGREWISFLLNQGLDAITIHGRTAKEMSKVPANWEEIGEMVKIKNIISPKTIMIGNGDIKSYEQALAMYSKYKVDGIMIGRGIFSNPWIFSKENVVNSKDEYIKLLFNHMDLFEKNWGKSKNFSVVKKFFKLYINDFEGAAILRNKLMLTESFEEIRSILKNY
jgi:nifR3 family TIM-barrel protein